MLIAFAGPSLPPEDRAAFPGVHWRPPAAAGDLLQLAPGPDLTICLIDGYFDHRPAVRHTEILYLLAGGARLFGASSMGALRAAEMDGFGLAGVGAIYRAYRRGTLTGDDEVALAHAGAEWNWRPLSLPLVELRATLLAARRARRLSAVAARHWLAAGRRLHYADRDWPALLAAGGPAGAWLQAHHVELKRRDARACLQAALRPAPPGPRPRFERTAFFDALAREVGAAPAR